MMVAVGRKACRSTIAAVAALVLVAGLGACGDDRGTGTAATGTLSVPQGPNPTPSNPGPNPSTFDPGPNPTDDGPVTVQGTVAIDVDAGCVTLRTDSGDLDLRFDGYAAREVVDGPAVVDETGTPVARPGDSMIVAGHPKPSETPCGARFDVDSLVNVTPGP